MDALPIDPFLPEVVARLRAERALVIVAEPGAGKTTRVPRALLDAGFADEGEILVLEPRRLAARLAAGRVADELGEEVGGLVGYQVRFEERASRRTRVRFVTEGILTRRLASDPSLRGVSAVIFDELHERHLHSDLGLALLRRQQQRARADLRLVAMSATLDAAPIQRFLDAALVSVPGRAYPVAIEHAEREDDRPLERRVAVAVRRLAREGLDGDVLVFLPGAAEIRRAGEALADAAAHHAFDVAVLHGDLPAREQDRAVRGGPRPTVILSTNVAESSVTIPRVTAVVDSGLARAARHSPWTGLPTLETVKTSRASATQRAGRAGRTRPGRCLRLYTEHDHATRAPHDPPEIRVADLCETVLLLRAQGDDPRAFPFLERPPAAALEAADDLLVRLGAVVEGEVTALGRRMLGLPAHPRLARLALEAERRGVAPRGCLVASLIAEREIRTWARTRIGGRPAQTDEVGASDLLARLEVFEGVEADGMSASRLRRHELDVAASMAVRRARDQLARALGAATRPTGPLDADEEALALSVLAAFPDRVGRRRRPGEPEVVFAGGGSGRLSPASVVKEAEWMVAVEVDDRRRGGAQIRAASAIEPEHLLELFEDRVEDRVDVRFDADRERVRGRRALLYDGLVLDESPLDDPSGPEAGRALLEAAVAAGIGAFCDGEAWDALVARLAFAAAHGLGAPPPDDLAVTVLAELCAGASSFDEVRAGRPLERLRASLPPDVAGRLDRFAPEAIALPGRRRVPVRYEPGRDPFVESRLQDFLGLGDGPRVADGRVPLVLHLLAPNRRAVQVTTDLAGFWERHYPALRRQLMRRYPRHAWPEDPRAAEPERRGR